MTCSDDDNDERTHTFTNTYTCQPNINQTTNHHSQWINEWMCVYVRMCVCLSVSHLIHHKNQKLSRCLEGRQMCLFSKYTWILIFDKLFCSGYPHPSHCSLSVGKYMLYVCVVYSMRSICASIGIISQNTGVVACF